MAGTLGGTTCAIIGAISIDDLLATIVLAAIGAVVSYFVSAGLKKWFGKG